MSDVEKLDAERQDLLDKIEVLKNQIKSFENEIGINTDDMEGPGSEEESHVLHKMLESEEQLGVMEHLIKKDAEPPKVPRPEVKTAAPTGVTGNFLEQSNLQLPSEKDFASSIKERSEQLEKISSMVSQLRENMQTAKKTQQPEAQIEPPKPQVQQAIHSPVIEPKTQIEPPKQETAKPVVVGRALSKEDLPLVSNLIDKLDSLIKSNEEIAERLKEMINENKNVSTANKISDLVKKLAQAGLGD